MLSPKVPVVYRSRPNGSLPVTRPTWPSSSIKEWYDPHLDLLAFVIPHQVCARIRHQVPRHAVNLAGHQLGCMTFRSIRAAQMKLVSFQRLVDVLAAEQYAAVCHVLNLPVQHRAAVSAHYHERQHIVSKVSIANPAYSSVARWWVHSAQPSGLGR